jgi:hypothetical protein
MRKESEAFAVLVEAERIDIVASRFFLSDTDRAPYETRHGTADFTAVGHSNRDRTDMCGVDEVFGGALFF